MKKIIGNLGGAIGSRYLKNHNQLVFVEYNGHISKINLVQNLASIVSSGTTILKGKHSFDCDTGMVDTPVRDLFWKQIDTVKRQMITGNGARTVNLGKVDFNHITPSVMQTFSYYTAPIIGNNDSTNKLVKGDVFCVLTNEGNYCKIKVLTYGYDLKIKWVTYKLKPTYSKIGSGYTQPEDIAVLSDEHTAYVTERGGNLLKVNLTNANRVAAIVVCSGLNTPQQIWVDEAHNQAYVVEYANPGKLVRVNIANGTKTVIYNGLNLAVGLTLSSDLAYAYISEQGISGISRIEISTGAKISIAKGLTQPFFLTWADASEGRLLVPERDPTNRISVVDVSRTTGNVSKLITGTSVRPSSISVILPGTYCVCCNDEIDEYFLPVSAGVPTGLYMGIGNVPFNLINNSGGTEDGKADTTTQPPYLYQFPKNSPFGGMLPVQVGHYRAWDAGARFYKVMVDNTPRRDTWNDLKMNPVNGKFEIIANMHTNTNGFYQIHNPADVYYNSLLGCALASTDLFNGVHSLTVEFYTAANAASIIASESKTHKLYIDNNQCVATLDMPVLDGNTASPQCGYLKYVNKTHLVTMHYSAYHPKGFATYSFSIVKGANNHYGIAGAVIPNPFSVDHKETVAALLGTCPTVAAFAESIYVATTVINGVGRQSQYDASAIIAFCLAP